MEDMDRFNALARQVTGGDRDPLRKAYALMLATGLTPKQLVDRGKPGIEALLRCTVVTRRAELVKNPAGLASRILLTVKRLSEQFPDCGLPIVPDPTMQPKIPLISLIREPRQFTTDRRNWVKIFDEEREADRNTGEADECTTPKTYVRSARMCLAVADVLGLVTDDTVGILALSTNDIFQMVFDRMDKLLTSANVASVAAGLSRIANDLYGEDPEHADHLEALRGEVGRRFPDLTLNDNSIAKIVHFLNDGEHLPTLLNAHRLIEQRSDANGLRPYDRVGRKAAALACKLKMDHIGLSPTTLAKLCTKVDFRRGKRGLELRLPDPNADGSCRWDPVDPDAARLVMALERARTEHGIELTLLFPRYDGTPRETRMAMKLVYDESEAVLGMRVTFPFIKDACTYAALKGDPEAVPAIAQAAGYRDPRSLARRTDKPPLSGPSKMLVQHGHRRLM